MSRKREPIAIVGIGCRFPGGANSVDSFWKLLREGRDAIVEVPKSRWELAEYFSDDPDTPGKMYTKWGGFLAEDVSQFDAPFFGFSKPEAQSTDPQQRLVLEVAWEALENACVDPRSLSGSRTGVFLGVWSHDYEAILSREPLLANSFSNLGSGSACISGRLSHFFDLRGPSLSIDTASSASLVAIHEACLSLAAGESQVALAGGVNLILAPEPTIGFCKSGTMAKDGRCKAFDSSADGYVRGEGCGILVLKRLSDALAAGDRIWGVIRGSAVNQDGHTATIMTPDQKAQEALIRDALESAGTEAAEVQYIEAHGTGTQVGDSTEIGAIAAVMKGRTQPLALGSVKTNIGHLESAAGVAGVIKTLLAMHHELIPKHLHLKEANPRLPLNEISAQLPSEPISWPVGPKPRVAGVNSFGMSGTNAHLILEEAPRIAQAGSDAQPDRPFHLLHLSASSKESLRALIQRYIEFLKQPGIAQFPDICSSANEGRASFHHFVTVLAATSEEAAAKLLRFQDDGKALGVFSGERAPKDANPDIAFLFTGQGSQYPGMGRRLYEINPVFKDAHDECSRILASHLDRPLESVLQDAGLIHQTRYTQAALFSLEYSICRMWQSWGVQPKAVLGHSVGELVAACVAGLFSLEDALKLVAARGRLMDSVIVAGAMAAIQLGEAQVRAALGPFSSQVSVAALNGPSSVVISGTKEAVEQIAQGFEKSGVHVKHLKVSQAFHSPLMDSILDEFEAIASTVKYSPSVIPLVSNVTGRLASFEEVGNAKYWRTHIREAVRFADGVNSLLDRDYRNFLEIGPGSTLAGMGRDCRASDLECFWGSTLKPARDDWEQVLETAAGLLSRGFDLDWKGLDKGLPVRRKVTLPTYAFQRAEYWIQGMAPGQRPIGPRKNKRTILGFRVFSPLIEKPFFEARFSLSGFPILEHSRLYGVAVVPASTFLIHVLLGMRELQPSPAYSILDFELHVPLHLAKADRRRVHLIFTPGGDAYRFDIVSISDLDPGKENWVTHATGLARAEPAEKSQDLTARPIPQALQWGAFDDMSLRHGGVARDPEFQWLSESCELEGATAFRLATKASQEEINEYAVHPGLIDSCLQALQLSNSRDRTENSSGAMVPVKIHNLFVSVVAAQREFWAELPHDSAALRLYAADGTPLISLSGVEFAAIPHERIPGADPSIAAGRSENPADQLWQTLLQTTLKERSEILRELLRKEVAFQIGKDANEAIATAVSLKSLGIDSLRSVELRLALQRALGNKIKLPPTMILDYPSIDSLVAFIDGKIPFLRQVEIDGSGRRGPELDLEDPRVSRILEEELDYILSLRKAS